MNIMELAREAWELESLPESEAQELQAFAAAVIKAHEAKLIEGAGEPVAWMGAYDNTDLYYRKPTQADVVPLYRYPAPVQQDERLKNLQDSHNALAEAHSNVLKENAELEAQNKALLEALKAIADYPELDALEMKREARAAIAAVEGKQ